MHLRKLVDMSTKFRVDYVLYFDGKVYAIEVKSGRRRRLDGLSRFLQKYPDNVPVIIDAKNVESFLKSPDIDLFVKTC